MVLTMRQCLIALDLVCLRSESLSKLGHNCRTTGARTVFVGTLSKVGNQVNWNSRPLKSPGARRKRCGLRRTILGRVSSRTSVQDHLNSQLR